MNTFADTLRLRVIKLGGSLLAIDDLIERFRRWHSLQSAVCDIVIVGGGAAVEELRSTQQHLGLDNATAHWLAIDAMSKNAARLAKQLAEFPLTRQLSSIERDSNDTCRWIFDPAEFLRTDRGAQALPGNWDVTSDSIAARVANRCGADELALLKSTLPEPYQTIEELAGIGYVDRFFPRVAAALPVVRCVDLRTPAFPDMILETQTIRTGA